MFSGSSGSSAFVVGLVLGRTVGIGYFGSLLSIYLNKSQAYNLNRSLFALTAAPIAAPPATAPATAATCSGFGLLRRLLPPLPGRFLLFPAPGRRFLPLGPVCAPVLAVLLREVPPPPLLLHSISCIKKQKRIKHSRNFGHIIQINSFQTSTFNYDPSRP